MITELQAVPLRIVERLNFDSECWLYTGPLRDDGYARVWFEGKNEYLHVLVWEKIHGKKPVGYTLDHLTCRQRSCCNHNHLELVTFQENIARGEVGVNSYSKTHCPQQHEYTKRNTAINAHGKRVCIKCYKDNPHYRWIRRLYSAD